METTIHTHVSYNSDTGSTSIALVSHVNGSQYRGADILEGPDTFTIRLYPIDPALPDFYIHDDKIPDLITAIDIAEHYVETGIVLPVNGWKG